MLDGLTALSGFHHISFTGLVLETAHKRYQHMLQFIISTRLDSYISPPLSAAQYPISSTAAVMMAKRLSFGDVLLH